jgi:acyl-CoA reductase-like NAD-dependent aldehyde dehydrogenase
MSDLITRVQAANIDGRARSPRFIQEQLRCLHDILVKNFRDIHQAISIDTGNSSAEVGIEYYLSLASLKAQYRSINPSQILDEEYSLAKGKDAPARRIAVGIVYIVPSAYSLFYSVITSLSAAIAAGNCVIIEVSPHYYFNHIICASKYN